MQSQEMNLVALQSLLFVITKFFLSSTSSFVVTISCSHDDTYDYFKVIAQRLFSSMDYVIIQLVLIRKGKPKFVPGPRQFNLYLVDSLQSFIDADPIQYTATYNTNEFYYVFLQQRDEHLPREIQGILNYCWRHHLINCSVQVQYASGQILVYTYFPFTSKYCGRVFTKTINKFSRRSKRMLDEHIFPKKLSNMYGCPLRVVTWDIPPFVKLQFEHGKVVDIAGFEGHFLRELARRLNFTIDIVEHFGSNSSRRSDERTQTYGDFINTGLAMLQNGSADISLGYIRENSQRNEVFTSLISHYQVVQILSVLRNGQSYSSLDILGFPFQRNTWIAILLVQLTGIIATVAYNRSTSAKSWMNFLAVAIGIPTTSTPHKSYRRLFYINWILHSFLLRSLYTGLLYHLFRTNLYRKPPNTLADLIDNNYSVVLNQDTYTGVSGVPLFSDHLLPVHMMDSIEEADAFVYLETHPGGRWAVLGTREILLYYGREQNKPGLFHILPEAVVNQQLTIYLTKHSFLSDRLNEVLQWIHAVGLMESWLRSELDVRYFLSRHLEAQKYIGQKELYGLFCMYGVLTLLALLIFASEIFTARCKVKEKSLEGG